MKTIRFAMVLTALLGLATSANAQSIGINFSADREDAALLPGEIAGVAPQGNWNNFDGIPSDGAGIGEGTAEIDSPNVGVVTDNAGGQHPGVTVDWTSRNAWNTNNGVGSPDNKLMNGYIDNNAETPQVTVNVGGLPAPFTTLGYDVYAYIGSDGNDRTGSITDGAVTYSYSTFSQQGGGFPGIYTQTTDTEGGNPQANYAIFGNSAGASGGASDSVALTLDRGSSNSGLHGVQVVARSPGRQLTSPDMAIYGGQIIGDNFEPGVASNNGGTNNWPVGEPPESAFDNFGQKYLNFAEINTGLVFTPKGGPSVANGITFFAANDAPARDPTSFELWGTNSDVSALGEGVGISTADLELIYSGDIAFPGSRNPGGLVENLDLANADYISFNDGGAAAAVGDAYESYVLIFPTVADEGAANSMQIAEVQLFAAVPEPSTALSMLGLLLLAPLARRRRRK